MAKRKKIEGRADGQATPAAKKQTKPKVIKLPEIPTIPNENNEFLKKTPFDMAMEIAPHPQSIIDLLAWSATCKKIRTSILQKYDLELLKLLRDNGFNTADHPPISQSSLIAALKKLLHHERSDRRSWSCNLKDFLIDAPANTLEYAYKQDPSFKPDALLNDFNSFICETLMPLLDSNKKGQDFTEIFESIKNSYQVQHPILIRQILIYEYFKSFGPRQKKIDKVLLGDYPTFILFHYLAMLNAAQFNITYLVFFYQEVLVRVNLLIKNETDVNYKEINKKLLDNTEKLVQANLHKWCCENLPSASILFAGFNKPTEKSSTSKKAKPKKTKPNRSNKKNKADKAANISEAVNADKKTPKLRFTNITPQDFLTAIVVRVLKKAKLKRVSLDTLVSELDTTLTDYRYKMKNSLAIDIEAISNEKTPFGFHLQAFSEPAIKWLLSLHNFSRQSLFELSQTFPKLKNDDQKMVAEYASEEEYSSDSSDSSTSLSDDESSISNEDMAASSQPIITNVNNNNGPVVIDNNPLSKSYYAHLKNPYHQKLLSWAMKGSLNLYGLANESLKLDFMRFLDNFSEKIEKLHCHFKNQNLTGHYVVDLMREHLTFDQAYRFVIEDGFLRIILKTGHTTWINGLCTIYAKDRERFVFNQTLYLLLAENIKNLNLKFDNLAYYESQWLNLSKFMPKLHADISRSPYDEKFIGFLEKLIGSPSVSTFLSCLDFYNELHPISVESSAPIAASENDFPEFIENLVPNIDNDFTNAYTFITAVTTQTVSIDASNEEINIEDIYQENYQYQDKVLPQAPEAELSEAEMEQLLQQLSHEQLQK